MPKDKFGSEKKKMLVVEEVSEEDSQSETPVSEETQTEEVTPKENEIKEEKVPEKEEKETKEEKREEKVEEVNEPIYQEKSNTLWIIIPTALLVGALVGGIITYFSGLSNLSKTAVTPSPEATVSPSVEATATPAASGSAEIKKEDLKIQVLNGSGVSGAAGKAKAYLEGLGYKNVEAGNAQSSDFAETEISIKESKKSFLETLLADLSKNYTVKKETKTLSASSKYDIVITLGKK